MTQSERKNNIKLIIFGNSGSGKTFLSKIISTKLNVPMISLDDIYWRDETYRRSRSSKWISRRVIEYAQKKEWVIEGIYSHLIKLAVDYSNMIIWLDYDYHSCLKNLNNREKGISENMQLKLHQYYLKKNGSSWHTHDDIYRRYCGDKIRVIMPENINSIINKIV